MKNTYEYISDDEYNRFLGNSFKLTVIAGLIAIGCVWGSCELVRWGFGL